MLRIRSIFFSKASRERQPIILSVPLLLFFFAIGNAEFAKPILRAEAAFSLKKPPGFHNIRAIAVDDEGRLCILDQGLNRVYVYDSQGKLVKEIGGKSAAEPFQTASGVAIGIHGEIAVSDYGKLAVLYFSKEGEYLRQSSREDLCLYSLSILKDGKIAAMTAPLDGGPFRMEARILDANLEGIATRGSVLSPQQGDTVDPFWISPIWKAGGNGLLYYSHPVDYKIEVFDLEGHGVRDIVKKVQPVRITEAEKEEASKQFIPPGYKFKFSEYHSAFQGFTVDDDGHVFVRTWEKSPEPGGFMFDVFDDQGRQIGRFPLNVKPSLWKKCKMYAIEGTETGAQMVRRYVVEWENCPGKAAAR
ncbi:MAG: hypothetical protein ABSA30_00375 [Candidatus Aminicenantales bacterium]